MSELVDTQNRNPQLRWRLLATVSAIALATHIVPASAQDASRPTVWIELGAQYENVTGKNDLFVPPYDAAARDLGLPSVTEIENALGKSFGGEGSLSFQPHGSDWIFTASARYGRTHTARSAHAQKIIAGPPVAQYLTPGGQHLKTAQHAYLVTRSATAYVDQSADNAESHAIVDFQVGKDVGLGLFGRGTSSTFSIGARYIQMKASSRVDSHTIPDAEFSVKHALLPGNKYYIQKSYHNSSSFAERSSDFRALGPSLSLSNTTDFLGNADDGKLSLDWGANIAVLFGRQQTRVRHQSITRKHSGSLNVISSQTTDGATRTTSRHVTVPNVGGFAAVSYRFTNAKISAGYRADFFFGALDRGLDTRDAGTTGFHGPFATVSFGLGG